VTTYTLYLDESGVFVSPERDTGIRVVAGVLLPGDEPDHDRRVVEHMTVALPWWRGSWHLCELTSYGVAAMAAAGDVPDLDPDAAAVLRAGSRNGFARVRRDHPRLWYWLAGEAKRLRRGVRHATAELVVRRGGALVIAIEHDVRPRESAYPAMTAAAIEGAAAYLAGHSAGASIVPVVEAGGPGHDKLPGLRPGLRAAATIAARRTARPPEVALPPTPRAKGRRAVFLADVVSYVSGPRAGGNEPLPHTGEWTLASMRARLRQELGQDVPLVVTDSLDADDALRRLLEGRPLDARPAGTVPACREWARELLERVR
jgi:hypothetical protein